MNKKLLSLMTIDAMMFKSIQDSSGVRIDNGGRGPKKLASFDMEDSPWDTHYWRFSNRVERWEAGARTHVIRAKVTVDEWGVLVESAWNLAEEIIEKDMNSNMAELPQLKREIWIDVSDWNSSVYEEDTGTLQFSDSPTRTCCYKWHEHYIERWEGRDRTDVFVVTLKKREWKRLWQHEFKRANAYTISEGNSREQMAVATTFDEYVALIRPDDELKAEIAEAFKELDAFMLTNPTPEAVLAERERLGLVT